MAGQLMRPIHKSTTTAPTPQPLDFEDLLLLVLTSLSARDLAAAEATCALWRVTARLAAAALLTALDPTSPMPSRCPVLALANAEYLMRAVGHRPEQGWYVEFQQLGDMAMQLGAPTGRVDVLLVKNAKAAELRHGLGWPLEHAMAAAVLCTCFRRTLTEALRGRSFSDGACAPASQWLLREVLLAAVTRQGGTVPPGYTALRGPPGSLHESDPSWACLEGLHPINLAHRTGGRRLLTRGTALAHRMPSPCEAWNS